MARAWGQRLRSLAVVQGGSSAPSFRAAGPGRYPQHLHLLLPITAPAGMVVCNWVVILSVCITVLCVFDPTGRTFVKLRATKRRQRNLRTYNLRSVVRVVGSPLVGCAGRQGKVGPMPPNCIPTCVSPGHLSKASCLSFLHYKVGETVPASRCCYEI